MIIINSIGRFLHGAYVALADSLGVPVDLMYSSRLNGRVVGMFAAFSIRWLSVSVIAFCVFKYGDKVIEWALK